MALRTHTCVILAALLFASSAFHAAAKQSNRSMQHVSVGVRPIVALAVSPLDAALANPTDRADRAIVAHATWAMSTNASGLDLTVRLDSPMPNGQHLEISAASELGEGLRSVRISSSDDVAIVSSIERGREKGTPIEFSIVGKPASAGEMLIRTVTFTLTDPVSGTSDSVSREIRFRAGQGSALATAR